MPEERTYPLSESVAQLSAARAVSERTVWRWVARIKAGDEVLLRLLRAPQHCQECGDPLPPEATTARRYCKDACRVRAHRRLAPERPPRVAPARTTDAPARSRQSARRAPTPAETQDLLASLSEDQLRRVEQFIFGPRRRGKRRRAK